MENFNPKKALLQSKIIYFAILAGSLLYLIVVTFLVSNNFVFKADLSDPLLIALLFLSIVAIPIGPFIARRELNKLDKSASLEKKFQVFQSTLIMKLASSEGVALFAVVCLFLTYNTFTLLFFIIAYAAMIRYYPNKEKIGAELSLSQQEIDLF